MPIPDEKARAWTRPEDYWPPRRLGRSGREHLHRRPTFRKQTDVEDSPRPFLDVVPFSLLMVFLGILAVAIMVAAWPGSRLPPKTAEPVVTEVGTAAPGWMDGA